MSKYILDTDHISLFQNDNPVVVKRVRANLENIATTIITAEEMVRGRFHIIRVASQSSQTERLILAYGKLQKTLAYFCGIELLAFSDRAYNCYQELRRQKIRIGTQDLRIAAIVLSNNGILVTRNRRDFARVPGLVFEDWTVESGI